MTRFLAALLIGLLLANAAAAARWFDALPADDPDLVVRRSAPPPAPPPPVAPPGLLYGATVGLAASVIGGIASAASGVGEAVWETAYMFGVNRTKLPRPEIVDAVASAKPPADVPQPERPVPSEPVAAKPSADAPQPERLVPVKPAAEPSPVVVAAASPQGPAADIDPGLLANFVFDRGARRADGSFFVPKPLQRLFDLRTARAAAEEVPVSVQLPGRIVPDPQSHGTVEPSVVGRIEPPPSGLPVLGDAVRKGQVLGYVVPTVGVVDRAQVRREVARLTTDIRVETENLEILKQFSFVPFRDGKIYQSEQRLAGLRREREALLPLLRTQEALHAPTDGVISVSTAIAGRVVQPGEKVFEIVNPGMLWVEASAPDPVAAQNAQRVATAIAVTPEGRVLALKFVGSGLTLQQQSTPILFRIDNPPDGLRVGRPVTVSVQSASRLQRGMPVTRAALSVGADGVQEVWEQREPEVFVPHAVRVQDIDGNRVLITNGVPEGARIVVSGVRLLVQLQ